jgi:hypothetical protein
MSASKKVLDCFAFVASVAAGVWLTTGWNWQPYLAIGAGIGVFLLLSTAASGVLALSSPRKNGGRI